MLQGNASRVFLEVSRKVDITEHKAEGRITYRMKSVGVPTRTNRLPLITTYFRSPVARVQLVPGDDYLDLTIDLRTPSHVTHRVADGEGGVVLEVDFPPIAGDASAGPTPGATGQVTLPPSSASGKRSSETTHLTGPGRAPGY